MNNLTGYRVFAKVDSKDVEDIILLEEPHFQPEINFCQKVWEYPKEATGITYCDFNHDKNHIPILYCCGGRPLIEILHIEKAFTPEFDKYFKGIKWNWFDNLNYQTLKKQLPILINYRQSVSVVTESKERETNDYYATDPVAIDKLVEACADLRCMKDLGLTVWEPACGAGHLSRKLIEHGFNVISSDITDRGYGILRKDFLKSQLQSTLASAIVTNPPYKYATEFVLHALDILPSGGLCAMFLKTTFLEGKKRRELIFDKCRPKYVFQFSERILCAKNGDFDEARKQGSAVSYAWFVWEKGYTGDTIVRWI